MNKKLYFLKNSPKSPQRIAKFIAASGLCSRRDAEKLIGEARVKISGKTIASPAINVTDEIVEVDGKIISDISETQLYIYNKPVGLIVTNRDEKGRKTIFDDLNNSYPDLPRLISVGRLDLNSEGLLLLTNNGELARELELPSNNYERVYRVRVFGELPNFTPLLDGITIDGVRYGKVEVEVESDGKGKNSWLRVVLHEGKNREIRRIMNHFGLQVNRLIRISYGKYELGDLKPGEIREVECE